MLMLFSCGGKKAGERKVYRVDELKNGRTGHLLQTSAGELNAPMDSDLERLVEAFQSMKAYGWDTNSEMKWGFFFVDPSKEKLEAVYGALQDKEYMLEAIYQVEDSKMWTLHASKIERLTPEKLHRRNLAFHELADHFAVECYDGWDVSPI